MAGDPRGNELLHSLGKVLTATQVAEAQGQARKLQQAGAELAAMAFAQ
jgi:hypothetical protein